MNILLAILKAILMVANAVIIPLVVLPMAVLRLIPISLWRRCLDWVIFTLLVPIWLDIFYFLLRLGCQTQWIVEIEGELNRKGWYFMMSNHRSWLDILVVMSLVNRKIPAPKFFIKQELLWQLPIIGLACWFLDFPFMKRHSKEYIKQHPEQRLEDIETTRKRCEIFKTEPVTIVNYLEGTRFTEEKHRKRNSPYQYLLSPKAGGMAFTFAALDGVLHDIIDVTVYYLPEKHNLWDVLCGRLDKIFAKIEVIPIGEELRGDYYEDKAFKKHFQNWLNERWRHKDATIRAMIEEHE